MFADLIIDYLNDASALFASSFRPFYWIPIRRGQEPGFSLLGRRRLQAASYAYRAASTRRQVAGAYFRNSRRRIRPVIESSSHENDFHE